MPHASAMQQMMATSDAGPVHRGNVVPRDPQIHHAGQEQHDHQPDGGGIDRPALVGVQPESSQQRRADGADRGCFRRRRDAGEDGAQHRDDQHYGRDQRAGDLHGDLAVRAALDQFVARDRRRGFGPEPRDEHLVEDIHADQGEAGEQRAREQVADRHGVRGEIAELALRFLVGVRNLVAQHDEDERGRDDLAERAGGADRPAGERGAVAAPEHGRQREQPHGHDRRADDAGRGGEQRADHADPRCRGRRASRRTASPSCRAAPRRPWTAPA